MFMKKNALFACCLLFLIGGCPGGDDNKMDLDETLYEEGAQVVKSYAASYYNEPKDSKAERTAMDASDAFLSSYEEDSYDTEEEEEFILGIRLLKEKFHLLSIQRGYESISGQSADESLETNEELKELLLYFNDRFGIELE